MAKWVYSFGDGRAEGSAALRDLLGGKGANLAEMANLGLPVPPGFTITTEVCTYFYENDRTYPEELRAEVEAALAAVAKITGKRFGDAADPLLVSVRSGSRASMPGMMDTVLNLGLHLDEMAGESPGATDCLADATDDRDVVVLDQDRVVEAVAVVGAAAAAHGVFLQRAEAGRRLAGAGDARLRMGDRIGHGARRRGDAGQMAEEVEGGAFGGEDGAGGAGYRGDRRAGGDRVAIRDRGREADRRIESGEGGLGEGEAGYGAGLARGDHRACPGFGGDRRHGGDVAGAAEILGERQPDGFGDEDRGERRTIAHAALRTAVPIETRPIVL